MTRYFREYSTLSCGKLCGQILCSADKFLIGFNFQQNAHNSGVLLNSSQTLVCIHETKFHQIDFSSSSPGRIADSRAPLMRQSFPENYDSFRGAKHARDSSASSHHTDQVEQCHQSGTGTTTRHRQSACRSHSGSQKQVRTISARGTPDDCTWYQ
jgi:hypothetical protein